MEHPCINLEQLEYPIRQYLGRRILGINGQLLHALDHDFPNVVQQCSEFWRILQQLGENGYRGLFR